MSGARAELLLDELAEAARLLEARLLLVGRLAAAAHHARELVAVDDVAGAELAAQVGLLGGRDDADAVGAGEAAELEREHAEAAGGAPDEHAVAGLQLGLADQHPVGGEVGQPVGGGLLPGQRGRLGQQLLGLDLAVLGERAPGRLVAPDPLRRRGHRVQAVHLGVLVGRLVAVDDDLVAGLPARHARADLLDDARRRPSRRCGGPRRGSGRPTPARRAPPRRCCSSRRRPSRGRRPPWRPARAPPSARSGRRRAARPSAPRGSPRRPWCAGMAGDPTDASEPVVPLHPEQREQDHSGDDEARRRRRSGSRSSCRCGPPASRSSGRRSPSRASTGRTACRGS